MFAPKAPDDLPVNIVCYKKKNNFLISYYNVTENYMHRRTLVKFDFVILKRLKAGDRA